MRFRKIKKNKIDRDVKLYKDYDWFQFIKLGNLGKLIVKVFEKYIEYYKIICKYFFKDRKLECIRRYYYVGRQDEDYFFDSSVSEEECFIDESESDVGEDIVLNEIGSEEEEVDDEVMEDDRMIIVIRLGRRILRRFDNDWLYY